ncbi:MAG: hypothetical protein KAR40_04095 [Candidatus Sabulitectum sp.]|nr:hypothetical protein [Candidatus Sabulitectum sp.]
MRLQKREITSRETIDRFITECSVVRLGLISRREPCVVPPLNFVYSGGTAITEEMTKRTSIIAVRIDSVTGKEKKG